MEGREGRRGREIEKEIRGGRVEKRRVGMVVGESRITVARRSINCPQVLFSLPRYFIYRQNVSLCACHGNADRIGTVNRAYFFSSFPFFFLFFSFNLRQSLREFLISLSLSIAYSPQLYPPHPIFIPFPARKTIKRYKSSGR